MPRTRGRTAEAQRKMDAPDWAEGDLKEAPGENIKKAADGKTPVQPYLPGQAPTKLKRVLAEIAELEKVRGGDAERADNAAARRAEKIAAQDRTLELLHRYAEDLEAQVAGQGPDGEGGWPPQPEIGHVHTAKSGNVWRYTERGWELEPESPADGPEQPAEVAA